MLKTHASDLKNITKQKPFIEHGCVYEKENPRDFSSKCSPKGVEKSSIYQTLMHLNSQIHEGIVRQGKFAFSTGIRAVQKADIRKLPGCIRQREVGLNSLT